MARSRQKSVRPVVAVLMGVAWAALVVGAVRAGPVEAVAVLIPVGVVASVSAVRAVSGAGKPRSHGSRTGPGILTMAPRLGVALVAPVVLPLAAVAGPVRAVIAAILVAAGGGAILLATGSGGLFLRLMVAVLAPSVAGMSVVLARSQGSREAVALIAAVCGYDMAAFVFGTGRGALGGPAGAAVGILTVAVVAVFVAATVVPPFSGDRPWIMFGLLAVLAPAGVGLIGGVVSGARLPALRRLDSLALSGPAWVISASIVLHR